MSSGSERTAQERVVHQVDLAGGQIVGRPEVGVEPAAARPRGRVGRRSAARCRSSGPPLRSRADWLLIARATVPWFRLARWAGERAGGQRRLEQPEAAAAGRSDQPGGIERSSPPGGRRSWPARWSGFLAEQPRGRRGRPPRGPRRFRVHAARPPRRPGRRHPGGARRSGAPAQSARPGRHPRPAVPATGPAPGRLLRHDLPCRHARQGLDLRHTPGLAGPVGHPAVRLPRAQPRLGQHEGRRAPRAGPRRSSAWSRPTSAPAPRWLRWPAVARSTRPWGSPRWRVW